MLKALLSVSWHFSSCNHFMGTSWVLVIVQPTYRDVFGQNWE